MILYTCEMEKFGGWPPGPLAHPCARAAKALDQAGHTYELRTVRGGILKLWTLPKRAEERREIEQLSGQRFVPILVLDDGDVITGSATIATWAREHAPASASTG